MEVFIFRPQTYQLLHNCSFFDLDTVAPSLKSRQNTRVGITLIVISIIMEILYIPCILSIYKHSANACYKIMLYIGTLDLLVIPISGTLTGWMAMQGHVFCTSPNFIYISGCLAFGLYCTVSMASMILALNRCIEMISPKYNEKLFAPKWMTFWLLIPTVYGFYAAMFTTPIKFTAIYLSWFFNPYVGMFEDTNNVYTNSLQTFNNSMESGGLLMIYVSFCCLLALRTKSQRFGFISAKLSGNLIRYRSSQIRSFIQVLLISAVNVVACTIYVLMNHMELNKNLIIIGSFGWLCIHGLPSIVYLTLNRTIRRDTLKLFNCHKKRYKVKVAVIGTSDIGVGQRAQTSTLSSTNNHDMF